MVGRAFGARGVFHSFPSLPRTPLSPPPEPFSPSPPLPRALAEELLNGNEDGTWLIRTKGNSANDFILSVVYKGVPTHHALVREDDGKEFALNKTPTGTDSFDKLVEKVRLSLSLTLSSLPLTSTFAVDATHSMILFNDPLTLYVHGFFLVREQATEMAGSVEGRDPERGSSNSRR